MEELVNNGIKASEKQWLTDTQRFGCTMTHKGLKSKQV
jgi:hypothetical protein